MGERALITGGAGFIGSNLAKRLLDEGWEVSIVDDLSSGEKCFVPDGINAIYCDFVHPDIIREIENNQFDVVFHLAAKPRVSYSCEHPYETNETNVSKTVRLLEACIGSVRRFVNTSSSAVYGNADFLPTDETSPHKPKSPYAIQKSITEQYCKLFSDLYSMDTVSIRPFNVFGPNQKGDNPYACAVSAWLYAVKHNKSIRSDGTGEQTRDINYVDNVVDMFYDCGSWPGHFYGDAFNGGTGFSVSNNEVLGWFKKNYPDIQIINAPWRNGDVMHTKASMLNAKIKLGFDVRVPFWEGIEKTRDWAMSNPIF